MRREARRHIPSTQERPAGASPPEHVVSSWSSLSSCQLSNPVIDPKSWYGHLGRGQALGVESDDATPPDRRLSRLAQQHRVDRHVHQALTRLLHDPRALMLHSRPLESAPRRSLSVIPCPRRKRGRVWALPGSPSPRTLYSIPDEHPLTTEPVQ